MDTSSIVMGAIIVAVCIVPIIMISIISKNKKKKRLQNFKNSAAAQNCNITKYEVLGNVVIGIDEVSNSLFFMKQVNDTEITQFINLADFQSCKVINLGRAANNSTIIEKLELCFYPKNKNNSQQVLSFYDSTVDGISLSGELQLIETWEGIVNSRLKSKD